MMKLKTDCCGCYACYNSCPKNCIEMEADEEGFAYPRINKEKCVNCGACEHLCPGETQNKGSFLNAFAVNALSENIRRNSSSGGIFSLLAEWIIEQGGIVFGAIFDKNMRLVHGKAETLDELSRMRGSKYLQSTVGYSYQQAKKELETNRLVYFSGTPCQISGFKAFLKKDYVNLICQDIACMGVPSPALLKKYLEYEKKRTGFAINKISFRDKSSGWKNYSVKQSFSNGKIKTELAYDNLYMKAFRSKQLLRPSCYSCRVKGIKREADITLADFWGIEHVLPKIDDDKGTSLVLVHTEKGSNIFSKIKTKLHMELVDVEKAVLYNTALVCSANKPEKREGFMRDLEQIDFKKAVLRWCGDPLILSLKIKIARLIGWR